MPISTALLQSRPLLLKSGFHYEAPRDYLRGMESARLIPGLGQTEPLSP